jgi:deoxyribose-phosphate aldolase
VQKQKRKKGADEVDQVLRMQEVDKGDMRPMSAARWMV